MGKEAKHQQQPSVVLMTPEELRGLLGDVVREALNANAQLPQRKYLDSDDVAAMLGVNRATVRKWVADRALPAYRVDHDHRFLAEEVTEWMRTHRVRPVSKPVAE